MKHFFNNIQTIIILVLIILLLLQRSCFSLPSVEPEVITEVEVEYDSIVYRDTQYFPKWYSKTNTIIDTFLQPIDTLAILKDYYAKYFYKDSVKVDTFGYVFIKDTITQNKIHSRITKTDLKIPTTTITKKIYPKRNEFYWGVNLQSSKTQFNYLGTDILFKNKRDRIYGLGVGVNQNLNFVISGNIYYKIGK